jgi:hypothetical protein
MSFKATTTVNTTDYTATHVAVVSDKPWVSHPLQHRSRKTLAKSQEACPKALTDSISSLSVGLGTVKICCSLFWHQILVVWILLPTPNSTKGGVKFRIHSMFSSHIQNDEVHNSDVKNVWKTCARALKWNWLSCPSFANQHHKGSSNAEQGISNSDIFTGLHF